MMTGMKDNFRMILLKNYLFTLEITMNPKFQDKKLLINKNNYLKILKISMQIVELLTIKKIKNMKFEIKKNY